jgi:C-terminal processing protease CtpA/Prc
MYIGEDVPSGIYIVTTEVNSPAAKANIQPGDRVLAVNGQLVSSMYKNPRETITEIAKTADSLTLSIEPSNLLQNIDLLPNTNFSNTSYRYISKETNGIDHDLEKYLFVCLFFCI